MMKQCTLFVVAVLLYLPAPSTAAAESKTPEILFVQTAGSVAFKDGVLTLKDVAPATTFFSDRPERITGHVRNDLFLKLWNEGKNSFKSDPPNASLSVFNSKGRPTQTVVVLSNPRVEGKNFLYDARPLKGEVPTAGPELTLFIDGAGSVPCDAGDDPAYSDYPCWAQNAFSDD